MFPTPTTDSVLETTKKYKQGGTPLTMAVRQMYPTPNATNINTPQPTRVEQVSSGGFILRKKNKPHMTYGARLQDVMHHLENKKIYPTPRASDHKDMSYNTTWKMGKNSQNSCARQILRNNKPGGKLNPNFVEFLMGYPMNWTKIEPTE